MYFIVLTMKGRPARRYSFPCVLYNLPDDDKNGHNI